jgi:hypothetical protein
VPKVGQLRADRIRRSDSKCTWEDIDIKDSKIQSRRIMILKFWLSKETRSIHNFFEVQRVKNLTKTNLLEQEMV